MNGYFAPAPHCKHYCHLVRRVRLLGGGMFVKMEILPHDSHLATLIKQGIQDEDEMVGASGGVPPVQASLEDGLEQLRQQACDVSEK